MPSFKEIFEKLTEIAVFVRRSAVEA